MNKQINLRLPESLLKKARVEMKKQGFGSLQELIKESLRKTLYEEKISNVELMYLKKLYKISEEKKLYGTEKDLFDKLNQK